MKKFLAMALCALMMFGMIAAVGAVDYVWTYDFEDDEEGDWIAVDKSLSAAPKQFSIQVVKFDGTMCMKYDHTDYVEGAGDKDCFSDLFQGGVMSVWGGESKFVLSYDVYFEKITDGENATKWQMGMLRMTPAGAGTQFQQSGEVVGHEIHPAGSNDSVYEIETGKWYNFSMAYDMENKVMSIYVNGDLVVEDIDWTVADTSADDAERIRIAWNGTTGDGIAYVDNIKFYNAEKPENATGKKAGAAAPATEAPATQAPATEAPATQAPATAAPVTQAPAATATTPAKTADAAVVIALVVAAAGAGAVVLKKKH